MIRFSKVSPDSIIFSEIYEYNNGSLEITSRLNDLILSSSFKSAEKVIQSRKKFIESLKFIIGTKRIILKKKTINEKNL